MCSAMVSDTSAQRGVGPPVPMGPPVLVLGLGNPLLGDDGVGWQVVDELATLLGQPLEGAFAPAPAIELDWLARGGLTLMERLTGYQHAVLVDAVVTGRDAPGTVSCRPLDEAGARAATHLDSAHDAPLSAALAAGRALGARLPDDILVVGIEARQIDVFDESLSPPVAAAVPQATRMVLDAIQVPIELRDATIYRACASSRSGDTPR